MQLAQVNIARLVAPLDDPALAEFVANLDPVNALAEQSPGFVWRLAGDSGNATDVPYGHDPDVIVNLSVWESIEALREFTYRSRHIEFVRRRREWFERMEVFMAMWWVPDGHRPTVAEARDRLAHVGEHGSTPHAFTFANAFQSNGDPVPPREWPPHIPRGGLRDATQSTS